MMGATRPPGRAVVVVGVLAVSFVAAPLVALAVRAPWSDLGDVVGDGPVRDALALSLVTASVAAAVATVLGTALGASLADADGRVGRWVRALVTLPLVLPPAAAGVALLLAFGRNGVLGDPLDALGFDLPFSTTAVVLAQVWVAMPFVALTAEAGFRAIDPTLQEVAHTLGAGPGRRVVRIDLSLARGAVGTGAVLAWARALGELGATITFAGIVPRVTETAPVRILGALETDPAAAVLLSLVLVALSSLVLVGLRSRWLPASGWGGSGRGRG